MWVVLSALLCSGRQVATRSSPLPPSPLWLVGSSPCPQVAPCSLWLGRSWGGMVKSQGLNFSAASTFHYHPFHKSSCCHHGAKSFCSLHKSFSPFHKSSCCKHHPAPPDYGMPPWNLLPPSAGPLRRGHFVLVFPPNPSPLQFTIIWGNWWLPLWVAEASLGAAEHGDLSLSTKG